jgi:hypothetical protein
MCGGSSSVSFVSVWKRLEEITNTSNTRVGLSGFVCISGRACVHIEIFQGSFTFRGRDPLLVIPVR